MVNAQVISFNAENTSYAVQFDNGTVEIPASLMNNAEVGEVVDFGMGIFNARNEFDGVTISMQPIESISTIFGWVVRTEFEDPAIGTEKDSVCFFFKESREAFERFTEIVKGEFEAVIGEIG
jgi:hypothetical protein